ncbi:MAG: DUF4317 domain-containing protein [Ruminococcus flavefaciens]|nr:DUF4317 domain-containing protein [Ruminococcus flavefaciens]
MVKKEISEIRKQCSKTDNSFTRICGCYVHGEDRETGTFSGSFGMLPEDDAHKYIDIFKKSLSGSLNKNLFNVTFRYDDGGVHEALDRLVKDGMKDEEDLETVYNAVAGSCGIPGNFAILLIHNRYDVPGKATDGTEMEDASEEVFSYISCAVCPVSLSKPGLAYQEDGSGFASVGRDWVAGMPAMAFLYPAFNGRSADTGEALYYSASARDLNAPFAEAFFGSGLPLPAAMQKACFTGLMEEAAGGPVAYGTACEVKDCLDEIVLAAEEAGVDGGAGVLGADKVKAILEGAADREIGENEFKEASEQMGLKEGSGLYAGNLTDVKLFEIRTPGALVRVDEGVTARPEVKKVDGRNCIVIPIEGDLEVNGIPAKP